MLMMDRETIDNPASSHSRHRHDWIEAFL